MADETNPLAPSGQTGEGKWTKVIQVACGVVVMVSMALTGLQEQFPNVVWVQVAGMLVGGLVSLLTQMGLIKSRTAIKMQAIAAENPPPKP